MKLHHYYKKVKFSISGKAMLFASSFLLSSGFAGIDAYADYCYFEKPASWEKVYVWAWNDSKDNCTFAPIWPGDQMALDEEKNLYYWESPEGKSPTMIIIHDNGRNRMYGANSVKTDGDTPFVNGATYHSDSSYTTNGDDPRPPVVIVADGPGAYKSWWREDNTVVVVCENATLYITPYSENVVKVFTLPIGAEWEERRSITVVDTPSDDFDVIDRPGEPLLIMIDNGTQVSIDRSTGLITFLDSEGNEKLSEARYLRNATGNHTVTFNPMGEAAFFGAGYNGNSGNIINSELRIDNTQTGGWGQGRYGYPHCIAIPFVASSNGYGVLFDDHWRGAVMRPSRDGLSYQSGAQNPISYYYVGGENLDDVMANYTSLTGRQDLPPYWALGYICSRYSYRSEEEAQNIINDIKEADIPLDGIVFDLCWEGRDESGMGNLTWYRDQFPEPEKMMSEWKKQGIHTIAITEPYFTSNCYNYEEASRMGYFCDADVSNMTWLRSSRVGLLDATNPDALDWMWKFYSNRTREGMSGWWLDLGEPEQHDEDSRHLGGSVSQVHNEFGQLWIERVYNGLREEFPDMRPFIMPRSGTSGMQRFSTFPWTGDILRDWSGLAAQVPALINMSMSGVSYLGSDVGGFTSYNGPMPELYLRWVEFATFSPMMRTHSADRPEPTNREYSEVLSGVRDFINLRYQFLPYAYTLSYLNTTKGWPLARPACAFDRDPARTANISDAYLWGKDIYVAPVLDRTTSRSITFPDGEWLDMNDFSRVYSGGERISYNAPLDCLPYFMRRGSFIPMFTQSEKFGSTSDINYGDITLLHYADTSKEEISEGVLYEDDRTSASSLENGEYALLHFRGEADEEGNYAVTIEPEIGGGNSFLPETRTIRLRLLGYNGVEEPKLTLSSPLSLLSLESDDPDEGENEEKEPTLEKKSSREEVDAHQGHAYCLAENGEIYLKASMPPTHTMTVSLGDISTGISDVENSASLVLEYVAGYLNYSIPQGCPKAAIELFAADGRSLGSIDTLLRDGRVHSIAIPEIQGFCIARLKTARGSKTIKFVR